jgi:hypothetical protein
MKVKRMFKQGLKIMGIVTALLGAFGCSTTQAEDQGYPVAPDAKFVFKDYIHLDTTNMIHKSTGKPFGATGQQIVVIEEILKEMHPSGSSVKALEETLYKSGLRKKNEKKIEAYPNNNGWINYSFDLNAKRSWGVRISYIKEDEIYTISVYHPAGIK